MSCTSINFLAACLNDSSFEVVIFSWLAKADLRFCFDDPVYFTKQREDHKVLSIFLETLDHGCGLAAATRVVVDGNLWLHWFSLRRMSP